MIYLGRAVFSISLAFCILSITFIEGMVGTWTEPVVISSSASDRPSIGIDARGNAIVVWREFDGNITSIKSSILPKAGTWSVPDTLFSIPGYAISATPRVAVSALGEAIAVWQIANELGTTVKAARLPFKGEWSVPVDISEPTIISSFQNPQIAIDLAGNATAIWSRNDGKEAIQIATLPFEGSWSSPITLSSIDSNAQFPQISLNLKGNAIAIWSTSQNVQAAERVGSHWSAPVNITSGTSLPIYPKVGLDEQGNAVAIWTKNCLDGSLIQTSTKPLMGNWSIPFNLSETDQRVLSSGFDLSIDSKGNATAVWGIATNMTNASIFSAFLPIEGSWSHPVIISGGRNEAYNAEVKTGRNGDTIAVWENDFCIQAAAWHAVKGWSSPVAISKANERSQLPTIAIDPSGYAVVVWKDLDTACIKAATWTPIPL